MIKSAKTILTKTLIIFTVVLVLLASIMPGLVFAVELKGGADIPAYNSSGDIIHVPANDDFVDFLMIKNANSTNTNNDVIGWNGRRWNLGNQVDAVIINQDYDTYNALWDEFSNNYMKFNNTYSNKFTGDRESLSSITNGKVRTPNGAYAQYIVSKRNAYDEYLKNNNITGVVQSHSMAEAQEAAEEENEWVSQVEEQDSFLGNVFQEICKLVAAIGDAVMNVVQGWMLPGSPEAVAKRPGNDYVLTEMQRRLNENDDGSYYFCFVKITKTQGDKVYGIEAKTTYDFIRDPNKFSTYPIPFIYYSPSAIFSNKIPALDINFIDTNSQVKSPFVADSSNNVSASVYEASKERILKTSLKESDISTASGSTSSAAIQNQVDLQAKAQNDIDQALEGLNKEYSNAQNGNKSNTASVLQGLISKWYVALRDIAILSLLVVLVYIGIRIVIASTGEEGAKYKKMIKDWVMAIVLVIVIHYIMLGMITIVKYLVSMLTSNVDFSTGDTIMNTVRSEVVHHLVKDDWLGTMGYTLMYAVLVWYVAIFTWKYLRRVIYMAFLTMIAPLVAITYPIDKIKDGRAQAFDMWFKEYLFNLLIQPIDLLLYTIFVTSAMDLIETNFIYAIVAIGFVLQGEKFIKSMFGLQGEGGAAKGGFASGMIFENIMSGLQKGSGGISNAIGAGNGGGGSSSSGGGNNKVRTVDAGSRKANSGVSGLASLMSRAGAKAGLSSTANTNTNATKGTGTKKNMSGNSNNKGLGNNSTSGVALTGNSNQNNENLPTGRSRGKRFIRGLGRLRGRYLNANTGMKLAKTAAKVVGGGALGTIGVAAGLASDDFSNVLKYGAVGAVGGAALTGELWNQAGAIGKGGINATDTFLQGYYGDEYQDKVANKISDKKWKYSEDTKDWLITKYGDEWKDKREEAMIYRQYGITSKDELEKAIKLRANNEELEPEVVGALFKEFKNYDANDLMNSDLRGNVEAKAERIAKEVNGFGASQDSIDATKYTIMNYLDQKYEIDGKMRYTASPEKMENMSEEQRKTQASRIELPKDESSKYEAQTVKTENKPSDNSSRVVVEKNYNKEAKLPQQGHQKPEATPSQQQTNTKSSSSNKKREYVPKEKDSIDSVFGKNYKDTLKPGQKGKNPNQQ